MADPEVHDVLMTSVARTRSTRVCQLSRMLAGRRCSSRGGSIKRAMVVDGYTWRWGPGTDVQVRTSRPASRGVLAASDELKIFPTSVAISRAKIS
jgi:hypothetical protein